jgi:type III restriction enzyme
MELKTYQKRVVDEVRAYLNGLADQLDSGNERHAAKDAWEDAGVRWPYVKERRNGLGRDLPTFCIKVPTGGGKTLLATQILGEIYKTILKERGGAGLVIWVVPSDQIYRDTLKALKDRRHFYRESLEHAVAGRVEVWEKHEIARLTPGQLVSGLNLLLVKLQGTNRDDKESLKFFRDSGGNIAAHFPPEDDPDAHRELKQRVPNLEMVEANETTGNFLARTSVANLVRLCEPAVILDEGHRATSRRARETIEGFNARIVVELSATPPADANVLVKVSGKDLLDEEMIKLPINVSNSHQRDWKEVLTAAKEKRDQLAKLSQKHLRKDGATIRPIVLVQVERTGKEQRDGKSVHSEDVREYLTTRLGIESGRVAVKTAEIDEIKGVDLLDEGCAVEWVLTKQALQEGWDCPYAYLLVSLSNTKSQRSMTQLIGRILRQPDTQRTPYAELNESYVFCQHLGADEVVRQVKKSLEEEGYEGEYASVVNAAGESAEIPTRTAAIRKKYQKHFGKPFKGRLFLPRFCVKKGDDYEGLDYFRHLLAKVDVEEFDYSSVKDWDFSEALRNAKEQFYRVTLGENPQLEKEVDLSSLASDEEVRAWLVGNLEFDWFSARQLRRVVDESCSRFSLPSDSLSLVRFAAKERLEGLIQRETDRLTQEAFYGLFEAASLCFYLQCSEGRFEIPKKVTIKSTQIFHRRDGDLPKSSLFDYIPDEVNEYEKSVALYLDDHPEVLWWYRNLVGPENFSIQGYRRNRIYPDFVVQQGQGKDNKPQASVVVIESKGKHLAGSEDTKHKRKVAEIFSSLGKEVTWQDLGAGFEKHQFRFQVLDEGDYADRDWKHDLNGILGINEVSAS